MILTCPLARDRGSHHPLLGFGWCDCGSQDSGKSLLTVTGLLKDEIKDTGERARGRGAWGEVWEGPEQGSACPRGIGVRHLPLPGADVFTSPGVPTPNCCGLRRRRIDY